MLSNLFADATGTTTLSGNLIPSIDNTYTLGSPSKSFKSVYIGPGSLFVNGEEVVHTDVGQNVIVSATANENLELYGNGTSNIVINPSGTGNILNSKVPHKSQVVMRSQPPTAVQFSSPTVPNPAISR